MATDKDDTDKNLKRYLEELVEYALHKKHVLDSKEVNDYVRRAMIQDVRDRVTSVLKFGEEMGNVTKDCMTGKYTVSDDNKRNGGANVCRRRRLPKKILVLRSQTKRKPRPKRLLRMNRKPNVRKRLAKEGWQNCCKNYLPYIS